MRQLTVRGVADRVVEALKLRAAKHGRSAEAEHRVILEEALAGTSGLFWDEAARLRDEIAGRRHSDSAEILREARDRRHQEQH